MEPTPTLLDFFSPPIDSSPEYWLSWGDLICDDPGDLHRVFFQNLDDLHNNDANDMDLYVSSMAQFQTSTFCWADHGLALSQLPVGQALHCPILSHFGTARSACSYSVLPPGRTAFQNGYQSGGTFTATTGKWVTRSTGNPLSDPFGLGPWSGLCFLGKKVGRLQFSQPTTEVLDSNQGQDAASIINNMPLFCLMMWINQTFGKKLLCTSQTLLINFKQMALLRSSCPLLMPTKRTAKTRLMHQFFY